MPKTILIDLDGVLNNYDGNFDKNVMPEIKKGAKEFLEKLSKDCEIKLFTTRNKLLTAKWIFDKNLENYITDITNIKDVCYLYIDDRCINFNGKFDELEEKIENFKPWYKNKKKRMVLTTLFFLKIIILIFFACWYSH